MNRAERRALTELQQAIAGPALEAIMHEAVLRLHGASPDTVETELAGVSEQLGGLLLQGGKVSRTVANGLVYATLATIRTRLATAPDGGTA